MSLLSLYSKIQLKIGKVEEEIRWLNSSRRNGTVEPECGILHSGSTALKGLWNQRIKLRLLFYKTLKIVVRFFALLFGDSSENYLIFTSEYESAKRLHSPKGTMEPTITFVCNNSFCQYKRFQKRVRFYSKTAFVGILICTIITSSVLYLFLPGKPSGYAKDYNWTQTDWSGGADAINFPDHTDDDPEAGWTRYYEKDSNINDNPAGGGVKLVSATGVWTQTSDAHFNDVGATKTNMTVEGAGDAANLKIALDRHIFDCTGGTDHGGADLALIFQRWTGIHCNINNLTIPSGAPYYAILKNTVQFSANTITIEEGYELTSFWSNDGITGGGGNGASGRWGGGGGGGAGYGSLGGVGGGGGGEPGGAGGGSGSIYGSESGYEIFKGSKGGNGFDAIAGGYGGVGMLLYANNIIINGTVSAANDFNGSAGSSNGNGGGGGGSGGTVIIDAVNLSGSGLISVNGSNGGNGSSVGIPDGGGGGGGGSGGRIKIWHSSNSFSGTHSETGGTGGLGGDVSCSAPSICYDGSPGANGGNGTYNAASFITSGSFISSSNDTSGGADFTTISWTATVPSNSELKFQIRSASTEGGLASATWYGPTGTGDYYTSSGTAINSVHDNNRWIQYKAYFNSTDGLATATLSDITINWGITSSLLSSPYNTNDSKNTLNQISWTETISAGTDIKFQTRTAPDLAGSPDWANGSGWCGPATCAATKANGDYASDYHEAPPAPATLNINAVQRTGNNDQWFQYKVWLSSTGANNPILLSVTAQYTINAPPVVSIVSANQISDDQDANYGKVVVSYNLSDVDSSSFNISILADIGIILNEELTSSDATAITVSNASLLPSSGTIQIENEQISYTSKLGNSLEGIITRGDNGTEAVAHTSGATIWIKGTTATGNVGVSQTVGTGKPIVWDIKSDLDGVYYATAKIRVTANDGNLANQVGVGDSSTFILDTANPVGANPVIIDSTISSPSANLAISVTDDSALQMRFANATNQTIPDCSADLYGKTEVQIPYVSYAASYAHHPLSPDGDGISTVCYEFKDAYDNNKIQGYASTPQTPINNQIADFSSSSLYRLLVWWDPVPDPGDFSKYNVYRSIDGENYTLLSTTANRAINYCIDEGDGNCTSDNVGTLSDITSYYYKVTAEDIDGISLYSTPKTGAQTFGIPGTGTGGTSDTIAPTLSSGPSASVSSSTAAITWATNEASYSLVRYGATNSLGLVAGSPTETVTSHSVDLAGLTPGTLYYYQILSADSSGNLLSSPASPPTGLHTFTTTADTTAPVISSGPTVTAGRDSATISWATDEASNSQVKYIIAVDNTTDPAGIGGTSTTLQTENVLNHFVIITGLTSDTTYNYQIISVDAYTNTLTSPSVAPFVQFTTSTDKADPDAPTITFNSSTDVTAGLTSATIVWTTNENSYSIVEYGPDSGLGFVAGTVNNSTTSHSVTISNLSNNTTYYYKLRSADSSGNLATEPSSGTHSFTTTADTIDPVISSVIVASSDRSSSVITWNTDENATSQVEYGINADLSGSSFTTLQSEKVLNHITVLTSLTPDISYYYRVISADAAGNSAQSSIGSFETISGAKPVITFNEGTQGPSLANSSLGDHTASATFSASSNGFFSIVYEASLTEPGSYTQEYGVPSLVTADQNNTISLSGLEENTKYYYKLRARDIYGNIGESSSVYNFTTTTDIIPPVITFTSSTDITSVTDSSAIISWTTNEAATSRVDYGTSVLYGSNKLNANYNINHSITLSSLLPATTYHFKLTSVDNSISKNLTETGDYTFATLASSDKTPPTISAVSNNSASYNSIAITWTTDENSNSLIDFGTATSYGATQGNSADSTISHSITLVGLAPDTAYYYRVKSMDAAGNIAFDEKDLAEEYYSFTTTAAPTPGDTTPPVISGVSSSSITSTSATIAWTTNESSDSTVGFSLDTSFDQEQGSTTATTSHSIALVNLAPETKYYYQVKSRDSGGNLGTDNNSGAGYSFTTLAGGDALAPIISDVTISDITANTAKISWTTNENSNSLVDYSGTAGVFTSTAGQYQDNTITHSVTLRGLDPSTAYYLQARSADASSNEGKDSNGGTGYTFTTTAGGDETPPEITAVSAGTPTYNSVTITWTTSELSNSLVDFGTTTSYGKTQGNSADSLTSHSVTLTGLTPSTAYYYRVKSIDVSGNLASNDNSGAGWTFTTAAGLNPGDTTAPVITFNSETGITNITSNSTTITWTTDESSDSTIGYSLDTSFNNEKGSATLTTSHSVILTNLSSGTAYKFQIKSMDGSGNLATENNSGAGYTFTTLAGGDSTAPIISDVASGTCADTTAIITWTTDENSSSLVDYGTVLGTYASTGGNYKASVTSHSVTLTGLTAETKYYYRVRSVDANGNQATDAGGASGYTFTTTATAASTCPSCPSCGGGGGSCPSTDTNPPTISNVKVSEITATAATVKWETNENGYSIAEFGLDNSYGGITGLYNNSVKSHSVKISGLESGIAYHYRAASADSSGNLAQSEDFTFKTLSLEKLSPKEQEGEIKKQHEAIAVEIQTKLEELLAQGMDEEEIRTIIAKATQSPSISTEGPIVENITNNSAKIIWITDRKSNSVIRFKVKEEGADPETSLFLKQYGNFKELAIEHQVILSGLQSGTAYQYQVQSSDILGNTGKSEWREFTTEITPSIYDVIISEITLNSAVISWKTNVVSSSKVEYGETINYADSAEDKDPTKVAKHSIKLNNLKSGTLYHFRVRGIGGEGSSLVSDDYSFTTFTLPQIETYKIEEIDEKTIKLSWKTNVETDSVLKYTDLETNTTKTQGEDGMSSIHNFTLKGLNPGIEYLLQIQGRDIYGNQAITSEFAATTLADNTPPQITQVRAETAVSSGKSDIVQTIISWKTSEPATSQILWEEGISKDSVPKNAITEDENYTTKHIMVITNFKPASVYRFRIQGKDKSNNLAQSKDFTILIPEKKKSVIQIIISNFEDTFGWVKKIGR